MAAPNRLAVRGDADGEEDDSEEEEGAHEPASTISRKAAARCSISRRVDEIPRRAQCTAAGRDGSPVADRGGRGETSAAAARRGGPRGLYVRRNRRRRICPQRPIVGAVCARQGYAHRVQLHVRATDGGAVRELYVHPRWSRRSEP